MLGWQIIQPEQPEILFLDEPELHLHPTWQRAILNSLKYVLPDTQIICATHSPQVIGETPRDNIYKLSEEGFWRHPPQSIGLSSNQVLRDIMGTPAINKEMQAKFEEIYGLVEQGEFDAAREKIASLRQEGQDFPELCEASSYMDSVERAAAE